MWLCPIDIDCLFPMGHTVQYVLSALQLYSSMFDHSFFYHAEIFSGGCIAVVMYLIVMGQIPGLQRSSDVVLYGRYS
jgi:hypothetical protein